MNNDTARGEDVIPFIFESLELYNYKLHVNTIVQLNLKPIIVISGANGSGKTQILEALIISLGYTPTRLALGKLHEVIGPFDDKSVLVLKVCNPRLVAQRVFMSSDPSLSVIGEVESFKVMTTIRPDGTIKRVVILPDGKKISITRKQLQRLFSSIGLVERAKLNFTEEGTLNAFDEGSPHKKLLTLLEATGVTNLYEAYVSSKARLDEYNRDISPLKMHLDKEKLKLRQMNELYALVLKKTALIQRISELEKELLWCEAINLEGEIINTKKLLNSLKGQQETYSTKLKEIEGTIKEKNALLQTISIRITNLSSNQQLLQDEIIKLGAEKEGKKRIVNDLKEQQLKLEKELEIFNSLKTNKGLQLKRQLVDKIAELDHTINNLKNEEKLLENKIRLMERKKGESDKLKRSRSKILGSLNPRERNLVIAAAKYKKALRETPYYNDIIGPLYEKISIKAEFLPYETSIKAALGRNLFSFVATSYEGYEIAKKIYDAIFPENKPNIVVGRVIATNNASLETTQKTLPPELSSDESIIDYISNLIDAPIAIKAYLRRVMNVILAKPLAPPNRLTDLAKKAKAYVLTIDLKGYYYPYEAFGRPPAEYNIKLGASLDDYQSLSKIEKEIQELEQSINEAKIKAFKIKHEINLKTLEKRKLQQDLQLWAMSDDEYTKEFARLQNELGRLRSTIEQLSNEIQNIDEKVGVIKLDLKEIREELDGLIIKRGRLNEQLSELEKQRNKLQARLKELSFKISHLESSLGTLKTQHLEALEKAEEKGSKPDVVRENKSEIEKELYRIKGRLEQLEIRPNITENEIKAQEKKVESLEEQLVATEEHLKNLKADVNARLKRWEEKLKETVSQLNKMLNFLLKDIFEEVSLYVSNYRSDKKSELIITALTKGDFRNYRQLSGGEKTLIAQALILSLHMITQSPIHAIDEFTQKLDKKNKAVAFSMALAAYKMIRSVRVVQPQFILICPSLDDVELSEEFSHQVLVETRVKKE